MAGAILGRLTVASLMVRIVHDLVRDAIADVIGKVASKVTIGLLTAGLAAPWAVSSVVADVSSWTAELSSKIAGLLSSVKKFKDLHKRAKDLLDKAGGGTGRYDKDIPTLFDEYKDQEAAKQAAEKRLKEEDLEGCSQ